MMRFIYKLFTLSLVCVSLHAQNLDSLYNEFLLIRGYKTTSVQATGHEEGAKCGFGVVSDIVMNLHNYDAKKQKILQELLQRPSTDTSFVTPNRKFRIHFNKSAFPDYIPDNIRGSLTIDEIPLYKKMYLDSLAVAVDSAFNYEVNILKYPGLPEDYGKGSDNLYDIYITNLGGGEYGYTEPDLQIGGETDSTYTSFMVIDNDFSDYYTKRIDAAKVTVAHEMHHGIQIGNYIYRSSDRYYYEITSSSMEEFVYDSINDYYAYIKYYFSNPTRNFSRYSSWSDGYDLTVWNIFMADRFGIDIIKRTWELMKEHNRALAAIAYSIGEKNSTFKAEFNRFGLWMYFTNFRAVPGKYFEEAANYPLVNPIMNLSYDTSNNPSSLTLQTNPMSLNFLYFNNGSDTLVSIISNSNTSSSLGLTYYYSLNSFPGSSEVVNGFYYSLESGNLDFLSESNIYNYVPVNGGNINRNETEFCYPQPFQYSKNKYIYFPVSRNTDGEAFLNIYSISMMLVYAGTERIQSFDKYVVSWDGMDMSGRKLPTGVYFFVTESGGNVIKGKFVIYND